MDERMTDAMNTQKARLEAVGIPVASSGQAGNSWYLQVEHDGADGIHDIFRVRSEADADDALAKFCVGCAETPEGPHFHPFPVHA